MALKLICDSVTATIEGKLPDDMRMALDKELSYFVVGYNFSAKFQAGQWDGQYHCLRGDRFPVGLLHRVTELLTTHGVSYTVEDRRPVYPKSSWRLELEGLDEREYQADAVATMKHEKYGGASLPPRAGKTLIVTKLMAELGLSPTVFLCDRIDLATQTRQVLQKRLPDIKIGFAGDGEWETGDVVVATTQSLMSAFGQKTTDLLKGEKVERAYADQSTRRAVQELVVKAKMLVYDEFHRSSSATAQYILKRMAATEYRIGISATPFREDNKDLLMEAALGPVAFTISYSYLVERGYLVPPHIHFIKLPKSESRDEGKAYGTLYAERVTRNDLRNDIIEVCSKQLLALGRNTLIIVKHVAHGKELLKRLEGVGAQLLTGKEKAQTRQKALTAMRAGKLRLTISTLFDEALDVPSLDSVIVAAGGDSAIKAFQRLRALTPYPGKKFCTVIDFLDQGQYLGKHARTRMELYSQEPAFEVRVRDWAEFVNR